LEKKQSLFVVANALGLALYIHLVWKIIVEVRTPQYHDDDIAAAFSYGFEAFPVLVAFAVANVIWLTISLTRMAKPNRRSSTLIGCATTVIWILTFLTLRNLN
jgi:hypothetical protein